MWPTRPSVTPIIESRLRISRRASGNGKCVDSSLPIRPNAFFPSPQADVVALGFKPGTDVYAGTGAWNPNTGYDYLRQSGEIPKKVNLLTVDRFFLMHPARLWRHIRANL